MSIKRIITTVNEISEKEILKAQCENDVDIEIHEMEMSFLKKDLISMIEDYIETGDFDNNDRYKIQLEKENMFSIEPTTFDILVAFEDYLKRKEEYQKERQYLSRDLSRNLCSAMRQAKDKLIVIISAFIRFSNSNV